MSAKVKLISFISAFVLVLGIMIIGVLSAEQVKVNIGGSVSFNATNVYARVSGDISGAGSGNKTFSTLTYSASETTGDESDWTKLDLEFTETPDPIVITITVENLSTQRTLTVNLENTLQGEGLDIAVTRDSGSYTSGANVELPASTGDGSSTTTFTLTLTVANPDQSLTDVNFGYILNMYDESSVPVDLSAFTFTTSGSNATLTSYTGTDAEVVIPSTISLAPDGTAIEGLDYTVTTIAMLAFRDCTSLTSITIPDSVTSIGDEAFDDCSSLTSITIPDGVTSIGIYTFSGCSSLTSITIPSSVTSIDRSAFNACHSLTSIKIPDSITRIEDSTFLYCSSLTSITIPSSVTSIDKSAFSGCSSLTSVNFGENSQLTSIGNYAFDGCSSLTSITINATTPPTLGSNAIPSSETNIYVPEESVEAYKKASGWSSHSSKISAIVNN